MISPKNNSLCSLCNPLFPEHSPHLSIGPIKCQNNYILKNTVSHNTHNNIMITCVHSYLTHWLVQLNTMHSATLCASLCSSVPPWGHSHRLQVSMNCSSMGPSHGVHSFQTGCSSHPRAHKSCQQPCSSVDLHGLPHHGLLYGLQGICSCSWTTCSPSSFTGLRVCRAVSSSASPLFHKCKMRFIFS